MKASLVALACALLGGSAGGQGGCMRTMLQAMQWSACADGTVWVFETRRPIEPFFSADEVPTLRERSQTSRRPALLMNGSYHDGDYARPKIDGLLRLQGREVGALKAGDRQLTHVMSIDARGAITAIRAADARLARWLEPGHSHVQSGPLILDGGRVAVSSIRGSLNGNEPYKRTAIGRTAAGETVIVIAKTPRTLTGLAEQVLASGDYRARRLTLLNLDGGPSTAIHSALDPRLSYGADKVTPVGFALR